MKLHSVMINVTKIRKERIFEGKKGKYLNLTVAVYDEKDKYDNNVAVWEEQTKEEREAKEERNFLGNGKTVFTDQKSEQTGGNSQEDDGDDLPF